MKTMILCAFIAILGLSCGRRAPTADQPTQVAALARELRASPDKADSLLSKRGLDRAGFDALMYEVAVDPVKAKAYREALSAK